jgi:AraC-like DNA-binding protein
MLIEQGVVGPCLDLAPEVSTVGVGVHGTVSSRDVFLLPEHWQLHLYSYTGELLVAGRRYPIRPGSVSLVPPATRVEYRYYGRSQHLYAHLRLPGTAGGPLRLPLIQDAGAQAAALAEPLHRAVACFADSPAHAAAEIWSALWRLAELPRPAGGDTRHPAVGSAMALIEAGLSGPLAVPEIARRAGISHNQLTRLFRAETGDTVVGYIRRRRLLQARHLLQHTTLSIPAVAATVGIADLQAFNKACRREFGRSPRACRDAGDPGR